VNRLTAEEKQGSLLRDFAAGFGMILAATAVGNLFNQLGFSVSTIISVYILAVLMAAVTTSRISGFLVCLASVVTFNFFFTEPKYTLLAYGQDDPVTFAVMFLVSLVACSLAERLKRTAREYSRTLDGTRILLESSRLLYLGETEDEVRESTERQLRRLLERDVILVPPGRQIPPGREYETRKIVLGETEYGTLLIRIKDPAPDTFVLSLMDSILSEYALTLENIRIRREKEEAAIRIRNEQFRSNLLRSISHDLRTPLTSISGNASNLLSNGPEFDEATRTRLYSDIYDDAVWLTNLVENLLSLSRVEDESIPMNYQVELLEDIVDEALLHTDRHRSEHRLLVDLPEKPVLLMADARLVAQVLINLVNNAIAYTPKGTEIRISADTGLHEASITVADNGPGIPDGEKERVFEMFYSGSGNGPENRRSVGMGLSLCRAIVQAHGGEILLRDNIPSGAAFTFTLPLSEVDVHE
jgi:two-component system sensor histidine kinase KdpD